MIEKWKLALREFLKKYEEDDDVIGALLFGSYCYETNNEKSDIDVQILLRDTCNYKENGVVEYNNYLIKYFMANKKEIVKSLEQDYNSGKNTMAKILSYGKIIYDLDGSFKSLQDKALEYIDKPFNNISADKLDINNYNLWNSLNELKVCLLENSFQFNLVYYNLLIEVYEAYSEYLSIPKLPKTKIYKILTDEEFRKKYHVFKLPEEEFIKLYLKCFEIDKHDVMYKTIEELINYYYEKQGGFDIKKFKIKYKLD